MANWMEGLTGDEVAKQRREFGVNVLAREDRVRWLKILVSQFTSPLVYVLFAASLVTFFLGEYVDTGMILIVVFINAVLGFVQEYRAERSLLALQSILTPRVMVYRDGERKSILVDELVVGDVVFLSDEHRVPADGIIIDEDGLFIDESVLTGESVSVEKFDFLATDGWQEKLLDEVIGLSRKDLDKIEEKYKVYMGTRVEIGVGKMLVVRIGKETQIGQIAETLKSDKDQETPLQNQIRRLSKQLALLVGIVSVIVLVVGLLAGDSFAEIFPVTVALAVAAIPEGLVISMTVVLAVGMQRILKQNAVVRSLTAAETLGSVDVICADKTGTLTEGNMKVTQAVVSLGKASRVEEKEIALAAVVCNDHRDPLETAMDKWARDKYGKDLLSDDYERVDSMPFSHKTRYVATLASNGEIFVSGAPEVVLHKSKLSVSEKTKWEEKFKELGSQGYRLVGFGVRSVKKGSKKVTVKEVVNLKWLGVLVYEDPVRAGVKEMMKEVMDAGVEVKVITGDYKETAMAIMRQVGVLVDEQSGVLTGDQLEKMNDEDLANKIDSLVLFARVRPQQKFRIVEALRKKGHVVAMTGDGVNDALALKQADIGIVVNESSDVAKETADLVLLKNDFGTIVRTVEEGRGIFDNLRKIIVYLLSDAFAGILVVIGSLIFGWPLPLLATQILWINLISDGFPSMALTAEPYERNALRRSNRDKRLLDFQALFLVSLISLVTAVFTLGVFGWFKFELGETLERSRTMAFAMLGTATLAYVFSSRSLNEPIWRVGFFRNIWLILGVMMGVVLQLVAIYLPVLQQVFGTVSLMFTDWLFILSGCALLVMIIEGVKFVTRR